MRNRRAALVLVLLAVLMSSIFATRLLAKPNPADTLPMPVVEQS